VVSAMDWTHGEVPSPRFLFWGNEKGKGGNGEKNSRGFNFLSWREGLILLPSLN
jgi:hypothetical protein